MDLDQTQQSTSQTSPPTSTDLPIISENIAPRRRNGRPQACEPCRKRKTACDHTLPVCLRCKRRSTTHACIYLNSPVAHARNAASQSGRSGSISQPQSPLDTPTSGSALRASNVSRDTINPPRRTSSTNDIHLRSRPAEDFFGSHNVYLGDTSFSAIFKENRANLDVLPTPSTSLAVSPEQTGLEEALPDNIMRMGLKVLDSIPDAATGRILLRDKISGPHSTEWTSYGAWAGLAGDRVMSSIWEVWDPDAGIRIGSNHETVVKFLCRNTSQPLEDDQDDPEKWRDSFSGRKMRWETLGLFFLFFVSGVQDSRNSDPHVASQPPPKNDTRTWMLELLECANSCVTLCNALESSNTLFIYLLMLHRILESMVDGDASPTLWRKHGELAAVTYAVGLHRVTDQRITLSLEWRRRVWARVFAITQTVSSFMGRPPLLSRRYSVTSLPLDLSDADLTADSTTLIKAISELDTNGWNTNGKLNGVTLSRARMQLAIIKDEIMEMVLGVEVDNVVERAESIKQRLYAFDAQLPQVLRWNAREVTDESVHFSFLAARMIGRLEYLHGHFMIERFVNKHTQDNVQVLLDLSRESLSITLNLFKHSDRFASLRMDIEWLIMTHAVPASGVLCLALLQQRFYGSASLLKLPRAEVIQDLSVFVAFLDWVKPNAPNAELCYRIREIVGKVLNQALEPPQAQPALPMDGASGSLYNFDIPENYLAFEEFNNFDLMATYDWVG